MHLLLSGASPGSIRLSNFHLIWLEPLPALHICRHRCCKVNLVSTDRMSKCKSPGMEQWSFFPKRMRVIQKIPNQRMSNCLHMHPDLMGSACLQLTFYQCLIRSCFQHFVMGTARSPCVLSTQRSMTDSNFRPMGRSMVPLSVSFPDTTAR